MEKIPQKKFREIAGEMEGLRRKPRETLAGLPRENLEKRELQELPTVKLSREELELAEGVFEEEETEELAESAVKVLERLAGKPLWEGGEATVKTSPTKPMRYVLSGVIEELVQGITTKIFVQFTHTVVAAAIQRIEEIAEKVVPELAEEAVKKEIRRVEREAITCTNYDLI